jgi:hypothetical protein
MKKLLLSLCLVALTSLSANQFADMSKGKLLTLLEEAMRKQLPMKPDNITTLYDVSTKGDTLNVFVDLNYDESTFNAAQKIEVLAISKIKMIKLLCENTATSEILDKDINYNYIYSLKRGKSFGNILVKKSDCKK